MPRRPTVRRLVGSPAGGCQLVTAWPRSVAAMPVPNLVRMANAVAQNYPNDPPELAGAEVADHIRSFWAPWMRAELDAFVDAGGAGLDPAVLRAVALLRQSRT